MCSISTEYLVWLNCYSSTEMLAVCLASVNCLVANGLKFSHPLHHLGRTVNDLPVLAIDSFRHMYVWRHNTQTDIELVCSAVFNAILLLRMFLPGLV